jgi:hypothetical protein
MQEACAGGHTIVILAVRPNKERRTFQRSTGRPELGHSGNASRHGRRVLVWRSGLGRVVEGGHGRVDKSRRGRKVQESD